MSETLYRLVDGRRVAIPEDEAAVIRAEWAANAAEAASRPKLIDVATLRERLEAVNKFDALVALLTPAQLFKLSTLREGVDLNDPTVAAMLAAVGVSAKDLA